MPVTSPFLKELMATFLNVGRERRKGGGLGIDFDELGVSEVVDLLDGANMEAVLRDFGDRNPLEDPVVHFYELFLKEYDPKKRMQRGVFYTPRPVVSYIVRSIHELLQTDFGLTDGLADTTTWADLAHRHPNLEIPSGVDTRQAFVQILDPATGTGTFLVEVVDLIYRTLTERWRSKGHTAADVDKLWNDYVPVHLLPRLHGYELLMAPYAIAHLKLGLKLYETGYRFATDAPARIFLTNALEPPHDLSGQFAFAIPALAREAQAVNSIKRKQKFTVVVGNPPYSNYGQLNRIPFILDLLQDYKGGLDERKINLDDDFIKFVRYSQWLISQTGVGCVGMITNHTFLDGVGHRVMRGALLATFSDATFLDLHGNIRRGELAPDGKPDENVFDIQQGVAISLLVKGFDQSQSPKVHLGDFFGSRADKYERLLRSSVSTLDFEVLFPTAPAFLLRIAAPSSEMFSKGIPLRAVFGLGSTGIETQRDAIAIHFSREDLESVLEDLQSLEPEEFRDCYSAGPDGRDWTVQAAKADVRRNASEALVPRQVAYRPFDLRWTFLSGQSKGFVAYPRWDVMSHLTVPGNVALVTVRQMAQDGPWCHAWVTNVPFERCFISNKTREANYGFLALRRKTGLLAVDGGASGVDAFESDMLGAEIIAEDREEGGVDEARTDLKYIYGLLSAPSYRALFRESLARELPRIFRPRSALLFRDLVRLGGELIALHLLESPKLAAPVSKYEGPKRPEVGRVTWSGETVWLDASTAGGVRQASGRFVGVPEAVWQLRVGSYQVCEKWLKDRKGRILSAAEVAHYQRIVAALSETIRLAEEIDEVIESYGGWPDAFAV